jgi:hypothetical protein
MPDHGNGPYCSIVSAASGVRRIKFSPIRQATAQTNATAIRSGFVICRNDPIPGRFRAFQPAIFGIFLSKFVCGRELAHLAVLIDCN